MLFKTKGQGSSAYTDRVKAYATSHTLTLTGEVQEINTKDHSVSSALVLGKYNWEVSTEGLFTEDDFDSLFDAMVSGETFNVIFGIKAEDDSLGQNIVDGDYETYTNDNLNYYSGNVLITSLVANANNGENATNSITFTGVGKLVATFNWEDVTSKLIKNSALIVGLTTGDILSWTFSNSSVSSLDETNYWKRQGYSIWRNNSNDKSVYQDIVVPYTGIYRLSVKHYSTYEQDPTVERQYGVCKVMYYNEQGTLINTTELASNASESTIMRGKSRSALTSNDTTVEIDGVTYYLPNFMNENSVRAYLNDDRYKLQTEYRLRKGQKIRIVLGQTYGGTKTNAVYGQLKLEYKFE